MKKIYGRIEEEFYTLEECQDFIYEIRRATNTNISQEIFSSLTLEECCDILNQENIFDCGTCYYVVDEDITRKELLKAMY